MRNVTNSAKPKIISIIALSLLLILPSLFCIGCGPQPQVTIIAPRNGAVYESGTEIECIGGAVDTDGNAISGSSLVWSSNLDGTLGAGTNITVTLSDGIHKVTLTATDSEGTQGSQSVFIRIGTGSTTTTIKDYTRVTNYHYNRMWPALKNDWYFRSPSGIVTAPDGSVYVVDTWNHRIQKFTADGEFITTWGGFGNEHGQFNEPYGIAIAPDGSLYVADTFNLRIQKFTADGTFVTSWNNEGYKDGEFKFTYDLDVSQDGTVYVADTKNDRIQTFTADGEPITTWGSRGTEPGQFSNPYGIAMAPDGSVYVTDSENHRIQQFTADGTFITTWGGLGTGNGQFDSPREITVAPDGSVFVSDTHNHRIQKFTGAGDFLLAWGGFGSDNGQFLSHTGIAVSMDGLIYVSDASNHRIQIFSEEAHFIKKWGSMGSDNGRFDEPRSIAVAPGGSLYVADTKNNRIQKFTSQGAFISAWGTKGYDEGDLDWPHDIAIASDGSVYILEKYADRVQKFTADGVFVTSWGSSGDGNGEFDDPLGVAVAPDGSVYVADTLNQRIQKFSSDGTFITAWDSAGSGNGQFKYPADVAVGPDGYVYIGDDGNQRIQKLTADGGFITTWGTSGTGEGQFVTTTGITVAPDGSVYVADRAMNRIQKFTNNGTYVTTIGTFGSFSGRFSSPSGVAVNNDGVVYVADTSNNRIQMFTPQEDEQTADSTSKAVIVAGGGPYTGNSLWDATQLNTNFAYRALIFQGFTHETVYYLSADLDIDIDGDNSTQDVDGDITNENVEYALTQWAADADDVIVYITDHGGTAQFGMNQSETLGAEVLDSWLDRLQESISGRLVFVYDACHSGSFVQYLTPPNEASRVVITSSSADEAAFFVNQGSVSFSYYFWSAVFNGEDVYDSFVLAKNGMELGNFQNAQLDDNGNGIANEKEDGELARECTIGSGVVTASAPIPVINTVMPDETIGDSSITIWVEDIVTLDTITSVWAHIKSPGTGEADTTVPVTQLPRITLTDTDNDGTYEASYSGFSTSGSYVVTFFAEDSKKSVSLPVTATVTKH